MRSATSFSIALFCAVLALGTAEDDVDCTMPPHSHHQRHTDSLCCSDMPPPFAKTKHEMHEIIHKCFEEAGIKKQHHGMIDVLKTTHLKFSGHPPPEHEFPPPPPPFNVTAWECVDQCLMKNLDYLSDDGELKMEEIKAMVAMSFIGDWASVGGSALEKCLASAKSSVGETSKCKSGAHQLMKCFGREIFLNCPASHWTENDECKEVKERLTKCPNMPAPKPHHKKQ